MNPHYPIKIKGKKMTDPKDQAGKNAPNDPNSPSAKNLGGKVEDGPNEKGTFKDPEDTIKKTSPTSITSPTQKEADALKDKIIDKEEKDDKGVITLSSAVDQEALDKHLSRINSVPEVFNETQALTGSPGNVNLTQDGRLNSDKSLRSDTPLAEQYAELNKITGPNIAPNRDGNETTKMGNTMTPGGVLEMNRNNNLVADDLKELAEKKSLTEDDRNKLKSISESLRGTTV